MSNAQVRKIGETLSLDAINLKQRGSFDKRHMIVAANQLDRVSEMIGQYLVLDSKDPDALGQRITKLLRIIDELGLLLSVENLNPPDPGAVVTRRFIDIESDIRRSFTALKGECAGLIKVNLFYRKNSARWDHGLAKEAEFEKPGDTYELSKGLIKDKLDEKMQLHLKKETGSQLVDSYRVWLFNNGMHFPDKSPAYTVTRFLLDNPDPSHWDKLQPWNTKKLGFREEMVGERREYMDHQIIFRDGRAQATVTIQELSSGNYLYLGFLNTSGTPKQWILHSVEKTVRVSRHQTATFMPRADQKKGVELPWSLKYAMRHDCIFLDWKPHESKRKHAEAVTFKSVQAAGGIVFQNGKIVAIDNVSGHYEPSYRLLAQAVRLIKSKHAFHQNAMVGVYSKDLEKPWFFPVQVFLDLAEANFSELGLLRASRSAQGWRFPDVNPQVNAHLAQGLSTRPNLAAIRKYRAGIEKH